MNTQKHALETLLHLLGPDGNPASQEAEEKLRILTAEADGISVLYPVINKCVLGRSDPRKGWSLTPPYPTSLDAICEAEKRFGIYDKGAKGIWCGFVEELLEAQNLPDCRTSFAFLTPAQRCIALILTAQWLKAQEKITS